MQIKNILPGLKIKNASGKISNSLKIEVMPEMYHYKCNISLLDSPFLYLPKENMSVALKMWEVLEGDAHTAYL